MNVLFLFNPRKLVPTKIKPSTVFKMSFVSQNSVSKPFGNIVWNNFLFIGDSAGGNLAMATSMKLSEDKALKNKLKLSALLYPLLQAVDTMLPSYVENDKYRGPSFSTKNTLIYYIQLYAFGNLPMTDEFRKNSHIPEKLREKYAKFVSKDLLPEKYRTATIKSEVVSSKVGEKIHQGIARSIFLAASSPPTRC